MSLYDIIHVEDEAPIRDAFARATKIKKLTYYGVESLQGLRRAVPWNNARVYFVDINFPAVDGGTKAENHEKAIVYIREHFPDANIFLVAFNGRLENIAKELNVDYFHKGEDSVFDIFEKLNDYL